MHVSLPPELENFVQSAVASGQFHTVSDVVRAGLLRLKEDQEARQRAIPSTQEELETLLLQRVAGLDRGEGQDAEKVFQKLANRIAETGDRAQS